MRFTFCSLFAHSLFLLCIERCSCLVLGAARCIHHGRVCTLVAGTGCGSWRRHGHVTQLSHGKMHAASVGVAYDSALDVPRSLRPWAARRKGAGQEHIVTCQQDLSTTSTVSRRTVFSTAQSSRIYSVNVLNFQSTVFISDFMHMRDKTVCGF